jgi:hypothetical protein
MTSSYFSSIAPIRFAGPTSTDEIAFRHYERDRIVLGKRMEDQLRFAVCYWHSFAWNGFDVFGYDGSFERPWHRMADPWEAALAKADAAFDFFTRLGAPFYCFHDRDVSPEGSTPKESVELFRRMVDVLARKQQDSGMKLLWGTANLFSHRRFIAGAATNPNPEVFALAALQVKEAMEATLRLGFADGMNGAPVALRGAGLSGVAMEDVFHQNGRPKADVLFVIDNSEEMTEALPTLANNLRPFLSFAQAQQIDFRIGVTTTGLEPGGDCPGGVGGGEDGRLFPVDGAVRFVTPETPDLEARWTANFQVGACRDGPNQILEAALRAATPPVADSADDPRHPEPADGNAGFLRPEAYLSVVAVTNRPDTSPGTANGYFQALQDVKGYRNAHLFRFSAITGDGETGCARDAQTAAPGDRLLELVGKTGGGVFQSILWPLTFCSLLRITS